jgi:hypothetical protein
VVFAEPDHLLLGALERGPPPFELDLGKEENLPPSVDGPFHRLHHPFEPVSLSLMDLLEVDAEEPPTLFPVNG